MLATCCNRKSINCPAQIEDLSRIVTIWWNSLNWKKNESKANNDFLLLWYSNEVQEPLTLRYYREVKWMKFISDGKQVSLNYFDNFVEFKFLFIFDVANSKLWTRNNLTANFRVIKIQIICKWVEEDTRQRGCGWANRSAQFWSQLGVKSSRNDTAEHLFFVILYIKCVFLP
jgi:hypothetical protein